MPIVALPAMRAAIAYSKPAAAASVAWHLANGTIGAGNVMQTEESVASASYSGSALGATWTWACKFTAPDDTNSTDNMFDSSSNASLDYAFQIRDNNLLRCIGPSTSTGIVAYTPGSTVVFVVCDEAGTGLTVYQDNSSITNQPSPGTGEWENGADLLLSGPWGTVDLLAIYDVALDTTQRAALYSSMSA